MILGRMDLALGCILAWLFGGIPFGLVLVRLFKGVDIRSIGSGNVGATNAARAFQGKARLPLFLLIYLLDFTKGFVPAEFGVALLGREPALGLEVLLGARAILGHCFSPFLRFSGGKGVATTTGVFAALELQALLIAFAGFFLVFALTRQVFLGSLALGLSLAVAVILREPETAFNERMTVSMFSLLITAFILFTHRSNIRQFLNKGGLK